MYSVGGLVAVVLIRPPEITFRFPRLYASIACYLSSLVAFIYWYILSETNTVFYLGGGLSFVGTIWLMKSFRRNPTQTYTADDFSSQSARSGSDLVTIVDGRWYNPGLQGKHLVKFERGWCFLEETGKRTTWIKPIQVFRADNVTLRVDTGRWRYGTLTLNFGSSFDADKAEDGLRRIMN